MSEVPEDELFDVIVIGGGPIGLFAVYYAGFRDLKVKLLEATETLGGQVSLLYPDKFIYDMPGFMSVNGKEMISNLVAQASQFNPTICLGERVLLSWSGTMFEYLMPALWMRSYPGTLIARTQDAVVYVQRAFGRSLGIPWGISESASSKKNDRGDYHYFAYGLPSVSLWPEAAAGPVISPYSTFLALAVDPPQALRNLRYMDSEGWVGPYGFYEAADYSVSSRKPVMVREWMAHHLGMSLLAIANSLRNNVVQQWFHAHPMIQATEMLLQEIPVNNAVLNARLKNLAPIHFPAKVNLLEVSRGATAAL